MNLLREYIREIIKEEDGILGKLVWPSADIRLARDEIDTDIEEELYRQLHNHFGARAPLSPEAVDAIKKILQSDSYPNIFKRCENGTVYRGMKLSLSWIEKYAPEALRNLPDKVDIVDWQPPIDINPITYTSQGKFGNVSSWTYSVKEAKEFTKRWSYKWSTGRIPVILHSSCDSGYFMYTNEFGKYKGGRYKDDFGIKSLNPNAHEREVLLFGDCIVSSIQVNASKRDIERETEREAMK